MIKRTLLVFTSLATTVFASETRSLGAHEHGVGVLNIAVDDTTVFMEFHAPGADIVGFEYAAVNAEDRNAIDTAVATLARPLKLFILPAAAECSVVQASAELEGEGAHGEQHAHEEDHAHEHDEHGANEAGHTEFHAEYTLTCANADAITEISFGYFDTFSNARELEVQIVSETGAQAFEVERDEPTLDLRGFF
ncbi:DUF2796 domain-containing protein [Ruegeria arenilitoris]|uniref:DUF2796 domain-containing protein n=1 Tax=Ruegeria arenilitoris TaxID=1173585 RepID=A0A238L0Q8_9RHOB|nr:DUF2796 domain-containing protein [Ruegeria arenilitoris]SMX48599.1 hypothetical protein RUA8715_03545 [Ruegeria arenilitoris]